MTLRYDAKHLLKRVKRDAELKENVIKREEEDEEIHTCLEQDSKEKPTIAYEFR